MSTNPETAIQKAILKALTKAFLPIGVFWRQNAGKVQSARGSWIGLGPTGISDIVGVFDGRPFFLEVKTPTGKQRPEQKAFQIALERAGGVYGIPRCVEDAVEAVWRASAPTPEARAALEARIAAARATLKASRPAPARGRKARP